MSALDAAAASAAMLNASSDILTAPFLDTCRLVLPVIGARDGLSCSPALTPPADSLGGAFYPARADVSGNIERLAARAAAGMNGSGRLFELVEAEVASGSASASSSCTKGLLWLKRFLEFTLRLLERLAREPETELGAAASAAYSATLAPFHGFLTTALFTAVLYAAPSRSSFERTLAGGGDADPQLLRAQMSSFCTHFGPLLARIHMFISEAGQDDPTPA